MAKGENTVMMFWGIDWYYFALVVPALILAVWAQSRVTSTFNRYSQVRGARGYTGRDAARAILDQNGLQNVPVEHVQGNLTDHYDPRTNAVYLSDSVYNSTSVAAVGIAAHEVGHAVQHATGYFPIRLRMAIIPITNIGSKLSVPVLLIGLLFGSGWLIDLGIVLYALMAVFQLITLPVEFNASRRALATLEGSAMLEGGEMQGARKVLSAAALTYVAALIGSLASLLRLFLLYGNRRRD